MKPQPQFLRIRWEDTTDQGSAITLEAILCLRHRQEIALAYPSARGADGRDDARDLYEAGTPSTWIGVRPVRSAVNRDLS